MKKYKVTVTNFRYEAPYIIVVVNPGLFEERDAELLARKQSGLSRFNSWYFIPRLIK